jgi:hypothetical protein
MNRSKTYIQSVRKRGEIIFEFFLRNLMASQIEPPNQNRYKMALNISLCDDIMEIIGKQVKGIRQTQRTRVKFNAVIGQLDDAITFQRRRVGGTWGAGRDLRRTFSSFEEMAEWEIGEWEMTDEDEECKRNCYVAHSFWFNHLDRFSMNDDEYQTLIHTMGLDYHY